MNPTQAAPVVRSIRVLLIEDNPTDADLLQEFLSRVSLFRFTVSHEERLKDGLARLAMDTFDVVLLDLSLPDSQSLDTFLKTFQQAPSVPIIILTGLDDQDLVATALQQGAQDYLIKGSLNPEGLGRCVNHAIKRKQWEHEIQDSRERFALAIAGSNDGHWDWTIGSEEVYFSPRCKELLGFAEHEFDNFFTSWSSRVHPNDFDRVMEALALHLKEKVPYDVEYRIRRKNGDYVWFSARGQAFWDSNDAPVRMSGSLRDITERKQAEESLRDNLLLRQREEFMATLSHDLKNPLIGANLVLDALAKGELGALSAEQTSIIEQIMNSNKHLVSIIHNMIDVYRYGKSGYTADMVDSDLRQVVSEAVIGWQQIAGLSSIEIACEIPDSVSLVMADSNSIRRVLNNLLNNAVKFTRTGGKITVKLFENAHDVLLSVSDNGVGIASSELHNLFEPFWQSGAGKNYSAGSGLGLYLSKQIIDAHGGEIICKSKLDKGTTFTISIPIHGKNGLAQSERIQSKTERAELQAS